MIAIAVLLMAVAGAYAQLPANCGQPAIAPNLSQKIVGGKEAVVGSWPWQVSLRRSGSHICGASIIEDNYVITAAHCTYGSAMSSFSLRAGRHTVSGTDANEQTGTPQTMWQHESYNPNTINNDITLFRISTAYRFNNYVNAVCLPTSEITVSGRAMYATGWGEVQGTCCSGRLKQAMLPSIDRASCQRLYYGSSVTNAMICAGQKVGDNICFGDSGGPLVTQVNGKWELHGASSWVSSQTCREGGPGVFTNIRYFDSWIRAKIYLAEAEEAEVAARGIRPTPYGAAFREVNEQLQAEAMRDDVADVNIVPV
jgi:secreted trypsin-like serine protease